MTDSSLSHIAAAGMYGASDQGQSAHQEDQHQDGMKQGGGLKVDMHVGDDTRQDEQRSAHSQRPSDRAAAIEKDECETE